MNKKNRWLKQMVAGGLFAAALTIGGAGNANLVQNGDFTNDTPNAAFAGDTNWSYTPGVAYIYGPNGTDKIGANGIYLWGPNNPGLPSCTLGPLCKSVNGLNASSPDGGNYLASDSDIVEGFARPLTQPIKITANNSYVLNFDYAAAQFRNANGTMWNADHGTQSAWQVSLGGTPLTGAGSSTLLGHTTTTPVLSIGNHGFSGWQEASVPFTATVAEAASGLLSFLAVGGPNPLPPSRCSTACRYSPPASPGLPLHIRARPVQSATRSSRTSNTRRPRSAAR
jgi:hypothetical protein